MSPGGPSLGRHTSPAPPERELGWKRALRLSAAPFVWAYRMWLRVRAWRRISFTAGGLTFAVGSFAVGAAAMNTGNNLLYLLLGAMLGFIAVSGWLSEKAISGMRIDRTVPRAVTVGQPMRLRYHVTNRKRRLPTLAVEIREAGLVDPAFLAHLPPGGTAEAKSTNRFVRRGIYQLGTVTLSTCFPFGMFKKERDIEIPGEVVVWPRSDRAIQAPTPGAGRVPRMGASARGAAGHRGEYRSLRAYRPGDDPRDIHWKSFARSPRSPVIREYERDGAETRWICLDTRGEPGDAAEVAVEVAASLASASVMESRPFALVTPDTVVEPGEGPGQLERILDVLARVDFGPDGSVPTPPVTREACVLVSVDGAPGFGDVVAVGRDAELEPVVVDGEAA